MAVITTNNSTEYNSGSTAVAWNVMTTDSTQEFTFNLDKTRLFQILVESNTTVGTLTISATTVYSGNNLGDLVLSLGPYDGTVQTTAGSTSGNLNVLGPFESRRFLGSTGKIVATFNTATATTIIGGRIAGINITIPR